MKPKTEKVLLILRILAWMGVIGYSVNFGAQAISFGVSFVEPAVAKQIPGVSESLYNLLQQNFRFYTYVMSFVLALSFMFIYLWYQVATLLSKLNIQSPFTISVSKKLEVIAFALFSIWLISFMGENYIHWVSKKMGNPLTVVTAQSEVLFTAGIVYVISQIFKHGIAIQEENLQTI
jgi:hypothetical protein